MGKWLTPNEPPADKKYLRRLYIPAAFDFLAPVNGALAELTYPEAWEEYGDLTPEQTAAIFDDIYRQYCSNADDPPEWENPDDLDGQPEQPWYDTLADWVIAGFLAITFTPQAALTYQATVPKLRVAIRTGNLGALFRVLINGVEVWSGDSYAPVVDLIDQVFDTSAYTEPFTVRVEHNGPGPNIVGERCKLEYVRQGVLADMVATILRENPTGCGIQWSTDDGGTWNTIDLSGCIADMVTDGIDTAIRNGVIAQPGVQPGPAFAPAPGECKKYHVVLAANGQWHLPSPVGYGDTLIITNVSGAWSDGTPQWFCPNGATYELGGCFEDGRTHEEGDPLNPGAYHMQIVMKVGDDWFPGPTALYTDTIGTDELDVIFQANDATLDDNTGSVQFDVEVCTALPSGWVHTFSSAADGLNPYPDGKWASYFGGAWDGVRWNATDASSFSAVFIRTPDFASTFINSIRFEGYVSGVNNDSGNELAVQFFGSPANQAFSQGVGDFSKSVIVNANCTAIGLGIALYPQGQGQSYITRIIINGTGTDPFI